MTKQFAIAARDHFEAILDQASRHVAFRRRLPVVTTDGLELEDYLGDLKLACTSTMSVDRLQHAPCAGQLLTGEARVGWNTAAMKGRHKARDSFHAIEALNAERNDGHERLPGRMVGGECQVEALPIAQIVQQVKGVFEP